jgi:hypothetical protein
LLVTVRDLSLSDEELVNLGDLLLEELGFSDKFVEISNSVKETSCNLSSHFSVNILNREKDRVSDELGFVFSGGKTVEFVEIDSGESHLSSLSILLSLLGRSHHVVWREVVLVHDGSVVLVLSLVTTLVSVSLVTTTSFLVAAATSLVVHTMVVVSTVLVLVIVHLLAELLGEVVLGSNDPFFFGLDLTNNVGNIFRGFILVLVVLSTVQFSLQTCDLLSWVGAEFLPVEHLRLFTAESLVFELLLWDPEFNAQRLVAEYVALVKVLDSEFGSLNIIVKNETLLVGSNCDMRVNSEFDGYDFSVLSEQINHLLLVNMGGDVLNEQVTVKVLCEGLSNRGLLTVVTNFVLSSWNVLGNEEEGSVCLFSFVKSLKSVCSIVRVLEADKSTLRVSLSLLDSGGNDFSVSSKNFGKLGLGHTLGHVRYEKVGELVLNLSFTTSWSLFLMLENLKVFSVEGKLGLVLLFKNLGGISRVLELDVSETTASSILEALDFAGSGGTVLAEEVMEFLLSDFNGEVANEKVGFGIKFLTRTSLNRNAEILSFKFKVVHFIASFLSSFLRREWDKTIV